MTKSLSERHQLFQAYQSHGILFRPQIQISDATRFYPELYDGGIRAAVAGFGVTSCNSVVTDKVKVRGTSYENGMLVILRYSKRQLEIGQIVSVVIKMETTVLLLLREKMASWVPELGLYEINKNISTWVICENVDRLNNYAPLSPYHRGARCLLPLKHIPQWTL